MNDVAPFDPGFVANASQQNGNVRVVLLTASALSPPVVPQQDSFEIASDLQGDRVATRVLDRPDPLTGR